MAGTDSKAISIDLAGLVCFWVEFGRCEDVSGGSVKKGTGADKSTPVPSDLFCISLG